jgi:muramoyltetrapeptide carboxypeptidase
MLVKLNNLKKLVKLFKTNKTSYNFCMKSIIPPRLKKGDEVRIIAPSCSLKLFKKQDIKYAIAQLEALGLKVTFGKHVYECDEFESSSVASRIEDLHDAFRDKNVKMILPVTGGFNGNQLLKYIDYELIKKNPKFITGSSDTTIFHNAFYAKTGLVTFQSFCFSDFGKIRNNEYGIEYFKKCFFEELPIDTKPSKKWDDSEWYEEQNNYKLLTNSGPWVINPGLAEGTIIGGNLSTLNLLQGTEYMPQFEANTILFLEDDYESQLEHFDRDLVSLIQLPMFKNVTAIAIGRFQKDSNATLELVIKMINTKEELKHIPVIANLDFGHTYPFFSYPIGGQCTLDIDKITIKY